MIKAGIIGANGYTGLELMNILLYHPNVKLTYLASRSCAGQKVTQIYPSLDTDLCFEDIDLDRAAQCDVVFLALPHGTASQTASELAKKQVKVVDLSADFRYDSLALFESIYGVQHADPELLQSAVYGLPELFKEKIQQACIIGNPGCYTTTSILPLFPLLKEGLIAAEDIIIDAKSGTTGAGRKADVRYSFTEVNENFSAYAVTTHRHTSEIEEKLSLAAGKPVVLNFTPHLLPVQRGILATIYANLQPGVTEEKIAAVYDAYYAAQPFTQVLHGVLPELKMVRHSNTCKIGYKIDARTGKIIIVSCLDNLIKGASGQAVQNMNLLFGLDETAGLHFPARYL